MKGGDHVSKARLIYFAVFAMLVLFTLLPAMGRLFPDGPHDGSQI
jgi:hypothetical protein